MEAREGAILCNEHLFATLSVSVCILTLYVRIYMQNTHGCSIKYVRNTYGQRYSRTDKIRTNTYAIHTQYVRNTYEYVRNTYEYIRNTYGIRTNTIVYVLFWGAYVLVYVLRT